MINKYIVDAHALIWHLTGSANLGAKAALVMQDPNSKLVLPIIALAEAVDVVQKKRTKIPDVATLLGDVFSDTRIEIASLTLEILRESLNASAVPEMHDRLITATATELEKQNLKTAILTKDPEIVASKLATIVW